MIGARMMNPTRNAPLKVNVKSEFAAMRSRFRTRVGIIAASAGTKKIVTVATRKFTTYATVRLVPKSSSGTIEAARNRFVTMSMSRRSVRSTMMPPAIPKSTAGMIASRIKNDDDVFECVISATRMISALVTAFAATCERFWAAQIARNARLRRKPRSAAAMLAPVNAPLVDRREWPALGEPLHVLFEIAPADEHAAPAGRAAKTDVGAEPDDAPGVAAARMRPLPHHRLVTQ